MSYRREHSAWAPGFSVRIYPARDGYIIIKKEVAWDIMFFVTRNAYLKLLEGEFSDVAMSPTGRKIAFEHAPPTPLWVDKPERPYRAPHVTFSSLKSIDLSQLDQDDFKPIPEVKHDR